MSRRDVILYRLCCTAAPTFRDVSQLADQGLVDSIQQAGFKILCIKGEREAYRALISLTPFSLTAIIR